MKKLFMLLCLFVLLFAASCAAEDIDVVIDAVKVNFTEDSGRPFIEAGRTLVPLRATMEAFGADVSWQADLQRARVSFDGTVVACITGENKIYRNGVKIDNDAAACIVEGRTYLPIRAVLEAFGAEVNWKGYVEVTSPYGRFVREMESGGQNDPYIWNAWGAAIAQMEGGSYGGALSAFRSLAANFVCQGDVHSSAMLYHHMGTCASCLGDYALAYNCYRREAEFWTAAGLTEETIDANRRASLIKTGMRVYAETDDASRLLLADEAKEQGGILIGAYVEGDTAIYDPYDPSRFYMDTFPAMVGKEQAGYLLYLPYGTPITHYASHIAQAKARNKLLQIALEPHDGMQSVNDTDGYLVTLARGMEASGVRFLLRFAGEMNDTTCEWYTPDVELYKEKFRLVANIFRQYAPSVPVIWSPNFYPESTMESYYPGDEYVDYVGVSAYKFHQVETDPLGEGVDRSRYSDILNFLCTTYGDRKRIIVSEGAPSYMDYDTGADITDFAVAQMHEYYTYLPIRYPSLSMVFYFDSDRERWKFRLSGNGAMLEEYRADIQNPVYTDDVTNMPFSAWYELSSNVSVPPDEAVSLAAHINYPYPENIAYVVYYVNGESKATSYGIPYPATVDFSPYRGQEVILTVKAFSAERELLEYTAVLRVEE